MIPEAVCTPTGNKKTAVPKIFLPTDETSRFLLLKHAEIVLWAEQLMLSVNTYVDGLIVQFQSLATNISCFMHTCSARNTDDTITNMTINLTQNNKN